MIGLNGLPGTPSDKGDRRPSGLPGLPCDSGRMALKVILVFFFYIYSAFPLSLLVYITINKLINDIVLTEINKKNRTM